MGTVAQHLAKHLLFNFEKRLETFQQIKAPEVLIRQLQENIDIIESQPAIDAVESLVTCKNPEILTAEFISSETHTGNGGKKYYTYQTSVGEVNYFPQAKFGRFVTYKQK